MKDGMQRGSWNIHVLLGDLFRLTTYVDESWRDELGSNRV